MPAPVKIPEKSLHDPQTELVAGDIVFFTMDPKPRTRARALHDNFVKLFQSFVEGDGGHKNITHIGLIVNDEYVEKGVKKTRLKMTHLLMSKYLFVDPTDYISKRTTIVYRPKNEIDRKKLGDELSKICKEKNKDFQARLHFRWWIIVGSFFRRFVRAMGFHNKELKPKPIVAQEKEHNILGASICPKFIADCYIEASRRLANKGDKRRYRDNYMNIAPSTFLKTFQSYVHNNINYSCYILPQKDNGYQQLINAIVEQRDRLLKVTGLKAKKAHEKAGRIAKAIADHAAEIMKQKITDPYRMALHLLKTVMPILRQNTGTGAAIPTSYKAVIAIAKSQGIYPEYCEADTVEETDETISKHLEELNYTFKQKQIYMEYRRRGFSDREAQFEAQPTLKQWCANHPRPLKTVSVTGLGFFGALAYGKAQAACTQHRNKDYVPTIPTVQMQS